MSGAGVSGAGVSGADEKTAPDRGVVYYVIDTCRADRLSLYGHDRDTTPFLKRLAEKSVVFERCYSQAPWTKPSMSSILTGRPPGETQMRGLLQRLPDSFLTFPEVLRDHGLYTCGFSANPIMGRMSNYNQGFRRFVESAMVNQSDPIDHASGSAKLLNKLAFEWMDTDPSWPYLLYMHSVDPHEEYEPPDEYRDMFADKGREASYRTEWEKLLSTRPNIPGNHLTIENFTQANVEVEPFIEYGKDLYDADIRANDSELERLFDRMRRERPDEDFIFVLTSDHGEEFFEHGATSHGFTLYDEMLHVPLLIYAPGLLPEGVRVTSAVRSMDVFPTVLDLLGVPLPEGISGRSLVPLIKNPARSIDPSVISEKREDEMARALGDGAGIATSIIQGRWKLIINYRAPTAMDRPLYELYDLSRDPKEQTNLAESNSPVVRRLEAAIMTWSNRVMMDGVDPEEAELSDIPPEVLKRLKELGYLGG